MPVSQNNQSAYSPFGLRLYRHDDQIGFSLVADVCPLPPHHDRFNGVELTSLFSGQTISGNMAYCRLLPANPTVLDVVKAALARLPGSLEHLVANMPANKPEESIQFVLIRWPEVFLIGDVELDGERTWYVQMGDFRSPPVVASSLPEATQLLAKIVQNEVFLTRLVLAA